ncbi:MAG: hypothetical protein A2507_04640 [Candidatus Magasanikbacteria bacterium RIFOXYD12_FULL_33_17]|nr:MAG: hypothetical protein A2507_04640 [Candidatus Magasanikbacteria bacterium RIFOXYD12_FULL_33_17]
MKITIFHMNFYKLKINDYWNNLNNYLIKKNRTKTNFVIFLLYFLLSTVIPFFIFFVSVGGNSFGKISPLINSKFIIVFLCFYFLVYYLLLEGSFPKKSKKVIYSIFLMLLNILIILYFNRESISLFFVKYVMLNMLTISISLIILMILRVEITEIKKKEQKDKKLMTFIFEFYLAAIFFLLPVIFFFYESYKFFKKVGVHFDIFEILYYMAVTIYSVFFIVVQFKEKQKNFYYNSTGRRGDIN